MSLSCLNHVKRTDGNTRPMPPSLANVKLVVDRSGSMYTCVEGAKEGMRTFLKQQKKMADQGGEVHLQVITFDDTKEVPFHGNAKDLDDAAIEKCVAGIEPRGTTRFHDTLGETLLQQKRELADVLSARTKLQKKLDVQVSGTCAIITDGEDNASKDFTTETIRKLVKEQRKNGVLCQFIAANMDALKVGAMYGYAAENSLQMGADAQSARGAILAVTSSQERQHSGAPPSRRGFTMMERQTSDSSYMVPTAGFGHPPQMAPIQDDDEDFMMPPPPPRRLSFGRLI